MIVQELHDRSETQSFAAASRPGPHGVLAFVMRIHHLLPA